MPENNVSFPKIPESNWRKLRDLLMQTVPAKITLSYLSAGLSISEESARANIYSSLKKLGFIDDSGTPTDLAYEWRDDAKYPEVCRRLLEQTYPDEVRALYSTPNSDSAAITSWFMNYCRCGKAAAQGYTSFYKLLLKADPTPITNSSSSKQNGSKKMSRPKPTVLAPAAKEQPIQDNISLNNEDRSHGSKLHLPQFHINIQLHMSPETTAEQIDKIFESMSRHMKEFRS